MIGVVGNWRAALDVVADAAAGWGGWAVTGSAALALHGVPVQPRDVDVLAELPVLRALAERLGYPVTERWAARPDVRAVAHAAGVVRGVPVELLAGVRNLEADRSWTPAAGPDAVEMVTDGGREIPVLGLRRLRALALATGRSDRVALIDARSPGA